MRGHYLSFHISFSFVTYSSGLEYLSGKLNATFDIFETRFMVSYAQEPDINCAWFLMLKNRESIVIAQRVQGAFMSVV